MRYTRLVTLVDHEARTVDVQTGGGALWFPRGWLTQFREVRANRRSPPPVTSNKSRASCEMNAVGVKWHGSAADSDAITNRDHMTFPVWERGQVEAVHRNMPFVQHYVLQV